MTTFSLSQERPEVSAEQRASSDLAKRVRKLRWMGMEEEARQLQQLLCRDVSRAGIVLADPHDTD
jgi:hypothetical protein